MEIEENPREVILVVSERTILPIKVHFIVWISVLFILTLALTTIKLNPPEIVLNKVHFNETFYLRLNERVVIVNEEEYEQYEVGNNFIKEP